MTLRYTNKNNKIIINNNDLTKYRSYALLQKKVIRINQTASFLQIHPGWPRQKYTVSQTDFCRLRSDYCVNIEFYNTEKPNKFKVWHHLKGSILDHIIISVTDMLNKVLLEFIA